MIPIKLSPVTLATESVLDDGRRISGEAGFDVHPFEPMSEDQTNYTQCDESDTIRTSSLQWTSG